ncbi:MAG: hypothetical protein OEV85_09255 [Candidatus Thorarchaeota archaeon]|nr:hypothetical protein [Candidatus Thorarchaeota archaeon]
MWLEITILIFIIAIIIFFLFWIVHEGSRWQKHPQLGIFARIVQASPRRAFLIFFTFTIMFIPLALLMMTGLWVDGINAGITVAKSDIVNLMLITLLVMAGAFPIMWGSFRTWRQAVRAEADMKVRPTGT